MKKSVSIAAVLLTGYAAVSVAFYSGQEAIKGYAQASSAPAKTVMQTAAASSKQKEVDVDLFYEAKMKAPNAEYLATF